MAAVSLSKEFFSRCPVTCARELIGCGFRWRGVGGIIVETEAYAAEGDPACHTFFKQSARDFVADQPVGCSYVYLNYGMYWLVNVLTKSEEEGDGFVLLRALHPKWGLAQMRERRQRQNVTDLCSGPGKLGMALGMGKKQHGIPLRACFQSACEPVLVEASPRIGISRAVDRPWRFIAAGNPHVSVKSKRI